MMDQKLSKMPLGLSSDEAKELLAKHGLNILPEKNPPSSLKIFFKQFESPLVYILLIAAIINYFAGSRPDSIIISLAMLINVILGFYQERKAKKSIHALKNLLIPQVKVLRDGEKQIIEATKLVPGDVEIVEIGDKISGDGILIEAIEMSINEAMLTGESKAAAKKVGEKGSSGTVVTSGRGLLLIETTGRNTEVGKIAGKLMDEEEKTPLEKRLSSLARTITLLLLLITISIFMVGIATGSEAAEMFSVSVALAVAAIPEGLVVSFTAILSIGMLKILRKKALIRNLASVETLGGVTVICADKTGTLTEGKMEVVESHFTEAELGILGSILCNNLRDPLESSMMEWGLRQIRSKGLNKETILQKYPRIEEIPFSHETKFIATLHEGLDLLFVSGAPEVLLDRCQFIAGERKKWLEKFNNFGEKGFRLVGFAYRQVKDEKDGKKAMNMLRKGQEIKLKWLGILVYQDPVRLSVSKALENCRKAGIKVKIITGDYLSTSVAVLEKLGITVHPEECLTGEELSGLSENELENRIEKIILFVRTNPFQKLKIVKALKNKGEIVAMMGDGVNDALALRDADIGIVVKEASEVAKDAADMILLDSNFGTILATIEEGRGILENLRKIILYLLVASFSCIFLITISILVRLPIPLVAGQILWINLIAHGLPALALINDPIRKGIMSELPVNPKEKLLNREMIILIIVLSGLTGIYTHAVFFTILSATEDLLFARSMAFAVLGTSSLVYVYYCRALTKSLWQTNIFSNKWLIFSSLVSFGLLLSAFYFSPLKLLLQTVTLPNKEWLMIVFIGFIVLVLAEGVKSVFMLQSSRK